MSGFEEWMKEAPPCVYVEEAELLALRAVAKAAYRFSVSDWTFGDSVPEKAEQLFSDLDDALKALPHKVKERVLWTTAEDEIGSESVVYLAGIPCVATLEAVEEDPKGVLRQIWDRARELNEEYRAEGLASFAIPEPVPLTRADVEAADYLARKGTKVRRP